MIKGGCICDMNPETTDGPDPECPRHGIGLHEWQRRKNERFEKDLELTFGYGAAQFSSNLKTLLRELWERGQGYSEATALEVGLEIDECRSEVDGLIDAFFPETVE